MSANIKLVDEGDFKKEIATGIVLVDFYADWCGPCRMMAPILEKTAKEISEKAAIIQVDIEEAQ